MALPRKRFLQLTSTLIFLLLPGHVLKDPLVKLPPTTIPATRQTLVELLSALVLIARHSVAAFRAIEAPSSPYQPGHHADKAPPPPHAAGRDESAQAQQRTNRGASAASESSSYMEVASVDDSEVCLPCGPAPSPPPSSATDPLFMEALGAAAATAAATAAASVALPPPSATRHPPRHGDDLSSAVPHPLYGEEDEAMVELVLHNVDVLTFDDVIKVTPSRLRASAPHASAPNAFNLVALFCSPSNLV